MYSSYTDIKLGTYCLYRHTTVLIHEILHLANQLWCSDFLTPPTPLIIPYRLPAFLESLMLLKNWCSIHARWSKSNLKHSMRFCGIFPSLKQNFIAYRSFEVSSRPYGIFEIHQLWQSGFSRVYSNCYCSCSFEPEIIKIGLSSHKMYSNKIVNFQESLTILNACTKKSGNVLKTPGKSLSGRDVLVLQWTAWFGGGWLIFINLHHISSGLLASSTFIGTTSKAPGWWCVGRNCVLEPQSCWDICRIQNLWCALWS